MTRLALNIENSNEDEDYQIVRGNDADVYSDNLDDNGEALTAGMIDLPVI